MNKKVLVTLLLVTISIILILFIRFRSKIPKNGSQNEKSTREIEYDDSTGLYYVRNKETNEIRGVSYNKTDLKLYLVDPNYDPYEGAYKSPNIEDWVIDEEKENIEIE